MTLSPASSVGNGLPLGLTGAVAATRYVGATTTGPPVAGTFAVGDFAVAQNGALYICTAAGSPGTWAAVSGGGGGFTNVVKAADESIASNTTPQADAELFFATVAGAVYQVSVVLLYGSPAGAATPDMKTAYGEDGTARGQLIQVGLSNTDVLFTTTALADSTSTIIYGTAAANRTALVQGTYIGGGNPFRVLWAQNVSGASPTIMRAGSALSYWRTA